MSQVPQGTSEDTKRTVNNVTDFHEGSLLQIKQ